jgi:hypothetical protein
MPIELDPNLYDRSYATSVGGIGSSSPATRPISPPSPQQPVTLRGRLWRAITEPVVEYGQMVGEGLAQSSRVLTDPQWRQIVQKTNQGIPLTAEESKYVLQGPQTYFMPEKDIQQFSTLKGGLLEGAKRTAGMEAYLAPGLIGANPAAMRVGYTGIARGTPVAARAASALLSPSARIAQGAARGAVGGGLLGFAGSETGQEIPATVTGTAVGGVVGGALTAAGIGAQKVGQKAMAVGQRMYQDVANKPVSRYASQIWRNIWNIPARQAFWDLRRSMDDTAASYVDLKVRTPLSVDDFNAYNATVLRALGDTVDDAVKAAPIQVPTQSVYDAVDEVFEVNPDITGKLGPEIKRSVANIVPTNGTEPMFTDAKSALMAERVLQKQAAKYQIAWDKTRDVNSQIAYEAYNKAAWEMKKVIDQTLQSAGVNTRDFLTPERIQQLNYVSPELARRAVQSTRVSQLRSLMQPFVRGDRMMAITLAETPGVMQKLMQRLGLTVASGAGGGVMFGLPGLIGGPLVANIAEPFITSAQETSKMAILPAAAKGINSLMTGAAAGAATRAGGSLINRLSGVVSSPVGLTAGMQAIQELLTGEELNEMNQENLNRMVPEEPIGTLNQ